MWQMASSKQEDEEADEKGWVRRKVEFYHEDEARFVVLGLGSRVEVVEPISLRERVEAEQAAVMERRRKSGRSERNQAELET